jgi:hypothetical protein
MAVEDRNYCLQRANEERALAKSSEDAEVAERHAELARLYELRAKDVEAWARVSTQIHPNLC